MPHTVKDLVNDPQNWPRELALAEIRNLRSINAELLAVCESVYKRLDAESKGTVKTTGWLLELHQLHAAITKAKGA